jgi:hypothetical protein
MEDKIDNKKEFKAILDQMNDIYIKKNNDYGDSFNKTCDKFGLMAPLIRMTDKLNRFEQLINPLTNQRLQDESIEDTLIDLANYAILTVLYQRQFKV